MESQSIYLNLSKMHFNLNKLISFNERIGIYHSLYS